MRAMLFSFCKRPTVLVAMLATLLLPGAALAEALASDWSQGFHSRARLTAATLLGEGSETVLYAGVDIRMDKNWKTYWKSPGDGGGIPPEFNWSRSQNVKAVRVMYPTPKLLKDIYGSAIGYKDKVIFPVSITPENPQLPVRLRLNVYYGVCEEICIPAEATLSLDVAPGARAAIPVQRDLMTAMAKVPNPKSNVLKVTKTVAKLNGKKPHLLIKVEPRDKDAHSSLFVASRDGDYMPIAKPIERATDGSILFRVDLSHMEKPKSLIGKTLDVVGAANDRGVSVPWTIGVEN